MIKIENLDMLKEMVAEEGCLDIVIILTGGLRSSKHIDGYDSEDDIWSIFNLIDDSEEDLTSKELWTVSNIGEAIDKGALFRE